jgi:ubiquinone/menaquinone biosynthesis C-methylase UbiE
VDQRIGLAGKRVLEVGAGRGYFSHALLRHADVTVLDQSESELALNPAVHKHVGDVYALPFESRSCDVVFSGNLLHHLDRPLDAIREMARVARHHVVLLEPNNRNPIFALGYYAPWMFVAHERNAPKYCKELLETLIADAGLRLEAHTYQGGFVIPLGTESWMLPWSAADSYAPWSMFQIGIASRV